MVSAPLPPQLAALLTALESKDPPARSAQGADSSANRAAVDPLHAALTAAVDELLETVDPEKAKLEILKAALRLPDLTLKPSAGARAGEAAIDSSARNIERLGSLIRAIGGSGVPAEKLEQSLERFVHLQIAAVEVQELEVRELVSRLAESSDEQVTVDLLKAIERKFSSATAPEEKLRAVIESLSKALEAADDGATSPEEVGKMLEKGAENLERFARSADFLALAPRLKEEFVALKAVVVELAKALKSGDAPAIHRETSGAGQPAPAPIPAVPELSAPLIEAQTAQFVGKENFLSTLAADPDQIPPRQTLLRLVEAIDRTLARAPENEQLRLLNLLNDFKRNLPPRDDARAAQESVKRLLEIIRSTGAEISRSDSTLPRMLRILEVRLNTLLEPETVEISGKPEAPPKQISVEEVRRAVSDFQADLRRSIEAQEKVRAIVQSLRESLSAPAKPPAAEIQRAIEALTKILAAPENPGEPPPADLLPESYVRAVTTLRLHLASNISANPLESQPTADGRKALAELIRAFQERFQTMIQKFEVPTGLPERTGSNSHSERSGESTGVEKRTPQANRAGALVSASDVLTPVPSESGSAPRPGTPAGARPLTSIPAVVLRAAEPRSEAAESADEIVRILGEIKHARPQAAAVASFEKPSVADDSIRRVIDMLRRAERGRPEKPDDTERRLFALMKEASAELEVHAERGREDIPAPTRSKLAEIQDGFAKIALKPAENALQRISGEAAKSIETLLKGQELLQQLTPFFQALGEPTFILFPHVIQNMLAKVELTYYPHFARNEDEVKRLEEKLPRRVDEADDEAAGGRKKQKRKPERHRVRFSVNLPALGPLEVDFSHTLTELLLTVTCETAETGRWLDAELPKLEQRLIELGYETVMLSARVGSPSSVRPDWVDMLCERASIEA